MSVELKPNWDEKARPEKVMAFRGIGKGQLSLEEWEEKWEDAVGKTYDYPDELKSYDENSEMVDLTFSVPRDLVERYMYHKNSEAGSVQFVDELNSDWVEAMERALESFQRNKRKGAINSRLSKADYDLID